MAASHKTTPDPYIIRGSVVFFTAYYFYNVVKPTGAVGKETPVVLVFLFDKSVDYNHLLRWVLGKDKLGCYSRRRPT